MRRGSALVVLAVGAIFVEARQAEVPKPDAVVRERYEENGLRIEGLGVCTITPEKVDCWNMAGQRDPALSDRIRAYYLGTSHAEVSFRFGQKNRYLVLRRTPSNSGVQYQTETGGYLSTHSIYGQQGEPTLEWGRMAADPDATEVAVLATFSVPGPPPQNIPFRRGEKRTFDGTEIEIGDWQPFPANQKPLPGFYPAPAPGKHWWVILGQETSSREGGYTTYAPLGHNGKLIRFVDRKGEPVKDVDYLRDYPTSRGNMGYIDPSPTAKYLPAQFALSGPATGSATRATTNVNPARIGFLRVSRSGQKRVLIQGFPLDPKG